MTTDRPSWIAPTYGYMVCLIAVITFLVSANNFVNAAFDRAYPLRGRSYGPYGESLTSFEAYRESYNERMRMQAPAGNGATVERELPPSEEVLRQRYEQLRQDRIEQAEFEGTRRLVSSGLLIAFAVGLFVFHWRWVRGRT